MLVLLDIDGVMVPAHSWKRPELLQDGFPAFGSKAIRALQRILSETNADILLTTSHKANYTASGWKNVFQLRGIDAHHIDTLPENLLQLTRKEEILTWSRLNPLIKDFIIIDDDKSLNDLPGALKERLIQTSPLIGLTDDLATQALSIVKKINSLRA